MYSSWDMVRDGPTHGKSDIYRWVPQLKNQYFQQSATLSGMKKKKKILNQILWYKLWYIGEIYTIPKFIKQRIEKTKSQLSIRKCGLGILDKDTQ